MQNQTIYTVGKINSYIKNMFTQDFVLNHIYIKGEVSNCKYHTSGHIYFSLKDETGTLACVMFAGQRKSLTFRMQDGQQVVVMGGVNVYERDGRYQLYAKEIILDGAGLLYERYEALKRELEEMGMFAAEYKQPIPTYIKTLGIVTAPTGAAVRDIMNISSRRNPYVQLILYPALVQGAGAGKSIAKGIQTLDEYGVDTIIVGRGGGSIEDLWAFNEEEVARAIFNCRTPIISAVGHETDTTIADYVADLRAPTPSAAAELAVADLSEFNQYLQMMKNKMDVLMEHRVSDLQARVDYLAMKMKYLGPANKLREQQQYLADLEEALQSTMREILIEKRHKLQLYIERMHGLSPLRKLNSGYSFVMDENQKAITCVEQVQEGDQVLIHVTNGQIEATVTNKKEIRRERA